MIKKIFGIFALIGLIFISGCAAPARVDQMVVSGTPSQRVITTPLRNNIAIHDVTGGQETNPMWKSNVGSGEFSQALEESLRTVGLLSVNRQAATHALTAHLERLDQPFGGFDMTVTASVNYAVTENKTGKDILNKTIAIPYTAKFGDAILGTERLKIANEGAVRVNIAKIIEEILSLKIDSASSNNVQIPLETDEEKLKELKRLHDAGLISADIYLEQQKSILKIEKINYQR